MPKITAIQQQTKRKKRCSIFVDDAFFCGVDAEIVMRRRLKTGQEIDPQVLKGILLDEEMLQARERCLRFLERRPHSRSELDIKCRRGGVAGEVLQSVLDDLEKSGLVDDRRFAESFIHDRQLTRPMGVRRLRLELRKRGIRTDIIDSLLARDERGDETAACLDVARRKARSFSGLALPVARRRLAAFLQRRGYDYAAVGPAVEACFPNGVDENDTE